MTPRRLAAAAVALAVVIGGVIAAIAVLTSDPSEPERPAAPAPAGPAAPAAAPAAPSAPAPADTSMALAARTPPPASSGGKPLIQGVTPRSGPAAGGGQAVIRGSNLAGVAQVMFGTTPARIAARADDALTVDVPSGAPGVATLVLTNADGSYGVAPAAYTYR